MTVQIKLRRDQSTTWTSANPTLGLGEAGYEVDTYKLKVGDGHTPWQALPYLTTATAANSLTGSTLASNVLNSSLTTVGTLGNLTVTNPISGSVTGASGNSPAGALTGSTIASNVVTSSLTSVGTLVGLTVNGAVTLQGTNTLSGLLQVTNATASSAYNNGALTVAGGVGIAGNANLNSNLNVAGTITSNTSVNVVGTISASGDITTGGLSVKAIAVAMAAALS